MRRSLPAVLVLLLAPVGVAQDGRPVLARAYGMADLEHDVPNTPQTVFEAGSVSKQFTAAAIVLLSQRGGPCRPAPLFVTRPLPRCPCG